MGDAKSRYYTLLPYKLIPDPDYIEDFHLSYLSILGNGVTFCNVISKPDMEPTLYNDQLKTLVGTDLEKQKKNSESGWRIVTKDWQEPGCIESNCELLEGIINYCNEHGWTPVLVTTPIHESFNAAFSKEFLQKFFQRINSVRDKTGNPLYLDYSHDARFVGDPLLFLDNNHLNRAGAQKFTLIVYDDLISHGLLKRNYSSITR